MCLQTTIPINTGSAEWCAEIKPIVDQVQHSHFNRGNRTRGAVRSNCTLCEKRPQTLLMSSDESFVVDEFILGLL